MIGKFILPYSDLTLNLKEYITSDTYVKPSNLAFLYVICIGAGGGGGGGRRMTVSGARGSGVGGEGGNLNSVYLSADDIGDTESVVVGAGGIGGIRGSLSTNNYSSQPTSGGDSYFGSYCLGNGGARGNSASNNAIPTQSGPLQPDYSLSIPANIFSYYSRNSKVPAHTAAISYEPAMSSFRQPCPGGANARSMGAGSPADDSDRGGVHGCGIYVNSTLFLGGTGGASDTTYTDQNSLHGQNGLNDIYRIFFEHLGITTTYGIGTGGGSGGCVAGNIGSTGFSAGNGGDGGRCCGGGGGASYGYNNSFSGSAGAGSGGNGGDGLVLILEFLK